MTDKDPYPETVDKAAEEFPDAPRAALREALKDLEQAREDKCDHVDDPPCADCRANLKRLRDRARDD